MAVIRKLKFSDASRVLKLISQIGDDCSGFVFNKISFYFCYFLQSVFPLKYKFMPESYLYLDNNEILGIITVLPTRGNESKINITKLVFKQNDFEVGKQLVDYIISNYGAKGAASFHVTVDQSHDELINLFLNGCGFRHCSYENLWKIADFTPENQNQANFRYCQNSDAAEVAQLYNSELKNHFKPVLERSQNEYKTPLFEGLTNFYKNRYVLEEPLKNRIIAYLSVTTSDNMNFIADIAVNDAYNINYDEILNFALGEIKRRKSNFFAFIKQRQYTKTSENFEEYLHKNNFDCIQTQCVLVKDFYKPLKETADNPLKVFSFGENRLTAN